MESSDQNQTAREGSTAIQAAGDVTIITGPSTTEVMRIAQEVFNSNFYRLAHVAKETATARAEEITGLFLSKLQKENPEGLAQSNDPDFQSSLFTVQKHYARTGDKQLGDLLVDLLVDRTKHDQRDILQIVLNESLETAPKLTEQHLAVLAIAFLFKYTQNKGILNHDMFGQYLDHYASPFAPKIVKNLACYQHLEFSGCGSMSVFTTSLASVLGQTYQGLFLKGSDAQEIATRGISIGQDPRVFTRCLNDPQKTQVAALNKEALSQAFDVHSIGDDDRAKITALFDSQKMDDAQIKTKCIALRPYMAGVFDAWENSALAQFTLTSVGIAIGHANIKRLAGEFANLAIWIN